MAFMTRRAGGATGRCRVDLTRTSGTALEFRVPVQDPDPEPGLGLLHD